MAENHKPLPAGGPAFLLHSDRNTGGSRAPRLSVTTTRSGGGESLAEGRYWGLMRGKQRIQSLLGLEAWEYFNTPPKRRGGDKQLSSYRVCVMIPPFSAPRPPWADTPSPPLFSFCPPSLVSTARLSAPERAALWDGCGIACRLSCPEARRQPNTWLMPCSPALSSLIQSTDRNLSSSTGPRTSQSFAGFTRL